MRVLVCGGRDYKDRWAVFWTLDDLHRSKPVTLLIHGGARGADTLASEWAKARGLCQRWWRAEWRIHGSRAGPIRNARMLSQGRPELVIAFPGGRGTTDMVSKARAACIPVREVA